MQRCEGRRVGFNLIGGWEFRAQKRPKRLSQFFGLHLPMKTTLLVRAVDINSKAMPIT